MEQLWHMSDPVKLYLPAVQEVQRTLFFVENDPASHDMQLAEALFCRVWNPASQSRHLPVSATGAYLPDSQSTQTLIFTY